MFNFPILFSFQECMKCLVRAIFFITFSRNISIYILIATIQFFFFASLVPFSLYSCFYTVDFMRVLRVWKSTD